MPLVSAGLALFPILVEGGWWSSVAWGLVWELVGLGVGEPLVLRAACRPGGQWSFSQVGCFFKNRHLKADTCALSRVPTASASLALSLGPSLASASLKRSISLSPHLVPAVVVPRWASLLAASLARCELACSMCCSRMCMEHERVDGNVRGQYGHRFSFDPVVTTGGIAAPCVRRKWHDVDRRFAWV